MASTYSPLLRFELIAPGEQAGLWGNTTNSNLGTLIEQAIAGVTTITLTSTADYVLSTLSGAPDEARSAVLVVTGAPGGTTAIVVPALQKTYHIRNTTASLITIRTPSQTVGSPNIVSGGAAIMHCDGVNVYNSIDKLFFSQMNFLTQNGGGQLVPQFNANGILSLYGNVNGTWDSGGGGYSLPINDTSSFASVKPTFALEFGNMSLFTQNWSGAGQSGVGQVVNGKWTGGPTGSMKYVNNGGSTMFVQGDFLYWWGSSTTSGGISNNPANYRWQMHLDCSTGGLVTRQSFGISDRRFKTDLKVITGALAKIKQLTGYTYKRTDMGADAVLPRATGLIAQDLQKVLPEAVADVGDGTLAISYGNLAGLFVQAFKELESRVAKLEAAITKMAAPAPVPSTAAAAPTTAKTRVIE